MKEVFRNEYCEIRYLKKGMLLTIRWLTENDKMSIFEFHVIIHILFQMVSFYRAKVVFIDAWEFDYPILKETIEIVNHELTKNSEPVYKIVKSKHLLGNIGLEYLLRNTIYEGRKLELFSSQLAGDTWIQSME